MDTAAFLLFFFVVIPFWLIHITRQRKQNEQIIASQKETNRLLGELVESFKMTPPSG